MRWLFLLLFFALMSPFTSYAQPDPNCPGAPLPRLEVGGQGIITPGSSNNVRDAASRDGNRMGSISGGEIISILEGPVCADELNWWRVEYQGGTGWTVEGTLEEYWIEPYDLTSQPTPTLEPTSTPEPTPLPVSSFTPPVEIVNKLTIGSVARVINDDPNSDTITLVVRSAPMRSGATIAQALEGDLLTIIGGPEEADGLRWWEVETARGSQGWVIEGLIADTSYERTLLPVCPAEGERFVFRLGGYIATSAPDGSEVCLFDRIDVPEWMTFSQTRFNFNNVFLTSPDKQYYVYADSGLYRLNRDGSERLVLTGEDVLWASLSPDGQRVAIATGGSIATLNIDGSRFATLTQGKAIRAWVEWLSDSETVIYSEQSDWLDQMGRAIEFTLYRVNTQEGGLRPVLKMPLGFDISSLALSPANDQLLVSGVEYGLIDGMSGNQPVKFLEIENVIAATSTVIHADTGDIVLEQPLSLHDVMWIPDSETLLGHSYKYDGTVMMSVESGEITPLTLSGDPLADEGVSFLGWESDTVYLLYMGYGFNVEPSDLGVWAVDISDGTVTRRR